jgi:hypothetical protein
MNKLNYAKLKIKAINFRNKGLSYNNIRDELNISKSTLSYWLKDIPLSAKQRKRLYTKQILNLSRGPQSQKERRMKEVAKIIGEAEKEIQMPLSFETYRFLGAALYWSEGNKTNQFAITNSDPYFIVFMVRWFEKIFGVPSQKLKARLNIYSQQNDLKMKQFWSQLTNIPIENFGKSFVKPKNKGYKKNNLYYGTIRIRVPKGTDMRHRVFGWIKAALKEITLQTEFVQKEWKSLKEVPRPINLPQDIKLPR